MNCPKVSLLLPIYNVEKYIENCAHSLFKQSYCNIEFIFVDDCSCDNSVSILRNINTFIALHKTLVIKQLHITLFSLRGMIRNSTRNIPILYEKKGVSLRATKRRFIRFDKVY